MDAQTVMKFLHKLLNRDNITFSLALIGSLGSFFGILQNRVKFDISIVECSYKDNNILLYLMIQNKSRLPISIGDVCVKISEIPYPCIKTPKRVRWDTYLSGKTATGYDHYHNMDMPINLTGLSGTSGYILFELPKGTDIPDSSTLTLQVSPSRGRAIEKKCQIPR